MLNEGNEISAAAQAKERKKYEELLEKLGYKLDGFYWRNNKNGKYTEAFLIPNSGHVTKKPLGSYERLSLNLFDGTGKILVSDYPDGKNFKTYNGDLYASTTLINVCKKLKHLKQQNDKSFSDDSLPGETRTLNQIVDLKYKNKKFIKLSKKERELNNKYFNSGKTASERDPELKKQWQEALNAKLDYEKILNKKLKSQKEAIKRQKALNAKIVKDSYFQY